MPGSHQRCPWTAPPCTDRGTGAKEHAAPPQKKPAKACQAGKLMAWGRRKCQAGPPSGTGHWAYMLCGLSYLRLSGWAPDPIPCTHDGRSACHHVRSASPAVPAAAWARPRAAPPARAVHSDNTFFTYHCQCCQSNTYGLPIATARAAAVVPRTQRGGKAIIITMLSDAWSRRCSASAPSTCCRRRALHCTGSLAALRYVHACII